MCIQYMHTYFVYECVYKYIRIKNINMYIYIGVCTYM